jgi:hypothetical protein
MNIYEKNLNFLKNNLEFIYEVITQKESRYDSNVVDIDNCMNCIVENDNKRCFIHSIYDTNREVEEMFKDADKDTNSLIVFGFGFGHCKEYIHDNFKGLDEIAIIEPDLNVFKRVLHELDICELQKYFKYQRLTFIINQNEEYTSEYLKYQFEKSDTFKKQFVQNISYRSLYNEYFKNVQKTMIEYIRSKHVNVVTSHQGKEKWTENCFKNLKIKPDIFLESFFNKFKDKTAILVSAGPSLNKNIHLLKELDDKAVIMAPGSAIKILDSHGIIPDFRFAIDGWDSENKIFQQIDTNSSPLIYGNSLNDKILPNYKGRKISMILNADHLTKYIYNKADISYQQVLSGFSISNIVLGIINRMGFKRIIFVGQDLCYTGEKLYAEGSWTKEELKNKKTLIKTKNIYGDSVYTSKPFLGMKTLFETFIKNNTHMEYINATEGGLGLEGAENKQFIEILKQLDHQDDVKEIKESILYNFEIEDYEKRIYSSILHIEKEIEEILKINSEKSKRVKKLKKYRERSLGTNKLLYQLDYMNVYEEKLEEISFYKEVIKPSLNNTMYSIKTSLGYIGDDLMESIKSKENILEKQTLELKEYSEFLLRQIEEFKSE